MSDNPNNNFTSTQVHALIKELTGAIRVLGYAHIVRLLAEIADYGFQADLCRIWDEIGGYIPQGGNHGQTDQDA